MALAEVLLELVLIVSAMLATATLVIVGPRTIAAAVLDFRWRLEACLLPFAALVVVLLLRVSTRDIVQRLERRVLRNNITPYLFELDQALFGTDPVAVLQSFQTEFLTSFFVFIYIYGYAFLLIFPFIAYFALDEMDDLSTLVVAFTANYAIGLVCYTLFIAFGPRNVDPLLFEGLLYDAFPQSRTLTNTVNQNTNVFPSLHTSLSMTVFVLAWVTREKYPLWLPVAGFIAISVGLSTMYLGIHWFSDVVAGTLLALVSVYIGVNYTIEGMIESVRRFFEAKFRPSDVEGE
ncbi:phosphatase PAP2 family protein [Natronorubrum sulfidifaciens]|uniref:PA-phosphatase-like phosphoesterase n=1 Tax=Natronorubrum sulfidifaciens JCM 14089 TaxID=1230460 RepID=L9VYT8_9EURY|nr:phosphatase PAP2 family protein [Natronorubrum sulfidifaciens]ELY42339.1 PA-phosphatase-like phosphoesterase [Natronorubrum sulfidifaciens JCM 14089]